jgi:hypothetical protein
MIVQSACQSASTGVLATQVPVSKVPASKVFATKDLSRPNCPHCSSVLLIAEESRFNIHGCIDHAWSCNDCGTAFVTSIRLWRL